MTISSSSGSGSTHFLRFWAFSPSIVGVIPSKHNFDQIRLRVYPRRNFTHGCAHWFWQRFPSNHKFDRPVSLVQENTLVLFEKSDWKITMLLFFVGKHMPCQSVHLQQTNDLFPPFWDDNLKWRSQDLIWESDWPKHCVARHPRLNCFLPSMPCSATKSG